MSDEEGAAVEPSADINEDRDPIPLAPVGGPVRLAIRYVGAGDPPQVLDLHATPFGRPGDSNGDTVRARLSRGMLETRLPAARVYFLAPVLDGWSSDQIVRMDVPPDQRLTMEVLLPGTPTLRVVDSSTGRTLPSARAWDTWDVPWRDLQPVPSPDVLARTPRVPDAEGRIVFSKTACARDLWIGAEGHAWRLVRVAPDDLDRRIELDAGGAIRVEVEGVHDWAAFGASLTSSPPTSAADTQPDRASHVPSWEVFLSPLTEPGRYVIDGLRPGRWRVQVGWKGLWGVREVLQTAEVEVRAGETTEWRGRVSEAAPTTTTVELAVVVPGAWAADPTFEVYGVGKRNLGVIALEKRPEFVQGPPGTWVSRLEGIPAGPYCLRSDELHFCRLLRVGPVTKYLRVLVPDPVMLRVRVVDGKTGAPVAHAAVAGGSRPLGNDTDSKKVAAADAPGSDGAVADWVAPYASAKCDAETGEATLSVPTGPIELRADAPGYVVAETEAAASAGTKSVHEIRLSHAGTLFLRVLPGGFAIPQSPRDFYWLDALEVEGLDPQEALAASHFDPVSTRLEGLRPGSYRVRVRVGWTEQVLTKVVDVRAREERTVTFELPAR